MFVFSAAFLCAAIVLTPALGSVGLVLANMINMLCRIARRCVVHVSGCAFGGVVV
jgi:hypothetical protein